MRFAHLAAAALDLAFPGTCVGCRREGTPLCSTCGQALSAREMAAPGVPIGLPGETQAPLLQLEWCAPFQGVTRAALHAIKYGGEQRLAEPLGAAIARRWIRAGVGTTLVTHVPVHHDRARQRGYDQAELIARSAARGLDLPHERLLVRARSTIAQFDLDRTDRSMNVHGAFAIRDAGAAAILARKPWVLLIDDVVTTGATLAACAVALEEGGAIGVSAITVAKER